LQNQIKKLLGAGGEVPSVELSSKTESSLWKPAVSQSGGKKGRKCPLIASSSIGKNASLRISAQNLKGPAKAPGYFDATMSWVCKC
jgi:hypothetical protein